MTGVDDWGLNEFSFADDSVLDPLNDPSHNHPAPDEPGPVYDNVGEFVTAFLAPVWRHRIDIDGRTSTWCRQWWRHPEAIARLDALWRAWENLRLEPATGMSSWFRDHADYHMAVLTSVDGPLGGCTPVQHKPKHSSLPVDPPEPATLFTTTGQQPQ